VATTKPLRVWLRAEPQPYQVRIRTEDDDERIIELTENVRHRWTAAEEAILASRAVVVECLDKKGAILRARELPRAEPADGASSSTRATIDLQAHRDKIVSRERAELAAFAKELLAGANMAFDRGRDAASSQHDAMMSMLQTVTDSYTNAIQNLHNVSVNFANLLTETAQNQEQEGKGDIASQLLAVIAARQAAQPSKPPNGGGT
jgi:hypothetical protein